MKKIFFSALAALSLVACVQEAVVDTPQGDAIAFENAFVDNATRATSLTAGNLEAFKVYGIVNNTSGVVFDGTVVSKRDGNWKYDGVKYWIPGQDYYFAALAPVTNNWSLDKTDATVAGPGVLTFNNNGEEDLIYAKAAQQGKQSGNSAVAFTFQHLLSKVMFSFTEGFEEEYINVNVKNITLNAPGTASLDLTAPALAWNYGALAPYVYGDLLSLTAEAKSTSDFFIIPGYDAYTIEFVVEVWQEGVETKKQEFIKTASINGLTFEIGKAYNLTGVINPETLALETIEFEVNQVEDWSNGGSTQFFPATPVSTAAELELALANGAENVILTGDIDIAGLETKAGNTAGLTITRDIVIDGNGHTLKYAGTDRAIEVPVEADVTIKNVSLVLTNSYCQRGINFNNAGTLTLENVKVSETGTAATYALNLPGYSDECNVIIRDSYIRGNIALNVWGENANIYAENTTFVSYDNSTAEGYAAVNLNNDGTTVANGTIININGGKIIAHDEKGNPSDAISNNTITGEINVSGETEVVGNIRTDVAIVDYGTTEFYSCATLQEAIDKAAESNAVKVKLIRDVELSAPVVVAEGKTVTLDLNGKTITAGLKEEGRHHYAIDNYGTLVIEGTGAINARGIENFGTMTINDNITITNVDTNGGSAIWNEGNLVVNGGSFTTNAEAGADSYGSALNTQKGGSAVINGGSFTANSQLTYAIINYGETVINNATVLGKHGAVASSTGCKTVINGGSFSLMENPGVSDHCAYYVSTIKGGTFTLGNNIDSGAKVFCESTIAEGYKAVKTAAGNYTVIPNAVEFAADDAAVQAALANYEGSTTIYLDAKEYTIEMYTNFEPKESLTIIGTEGTKVKFANAQVRLHLAKNFTIKNCEILHMATKTWGMLVFGGRDSGAVNCTVSNCSFKGVGTQGIYINENISGAVYNIENCTFDGDFGSEGAITIQDNADVHFTVNVNGCAFNNIPSTSHEVCLIYGNDDFTLNSDVELEVYTK